MTFNVVLAPTGMDALVALSLGFRTTTLQVILMPFRFAVT